MKNTLKVEH